MRLLTFVCKEFATPLPGTLSTMSQPPWAGFCKHGRRRLVPADIIPAYQALGGIRRAPRPARPSMSLHVIGLNHESASLEVREKLAFPPERQGDALADLAAQPGVAEV